MKINTILLWLMLGLIVPNYGQLPAQLLSEYLATHHLEKVYINHDKPYYTTGETIWCKVHLLNGRTHQAFEASPIVYVDWINPKGEIVKTYYLKIKAGIAALDIQTDTTWAAGNYTLRGYTLYQKNFEEAYLFQKEILLTDFYKKEIKKATKELDFSVQFFPEGGDLVTGLSSKVAFKAQNKKGEAIEVNGVLETAKGQMITPLKSLHEGMGFFNLLPTEKTTYLATFTHLGQTKTFELPPSLEKGYVVKIDTRPADQIKVKITGNTKPLLAGCTLIGQVRGQVFLSQQLAEEEKMIALAINKSTLPVGLLHFTLFNRQNYPVSERLIFNKKKAEKIATTINISNQIIKNRTLVKGTIASLQTSKIIPSQLSISIYNQDLIADDLQGLTIENYLLLQSDLKGHISNINQYFQKDDTKTRTLLDLLLLTHGWRRFTWQQVLNKEKIDLIYPTEETFSFAGQVKKEGKNKPVKADVFLNILTQKDFAFANMTTGAEGLFLFEGFAFEDTTDLLIQANIFNERKAKKVKEGTTKRVGNKFVDIEVFNLHETPYNPTLSLKPAQLQPAVLEQKVAEIAEIQGATIIDSSLWSIDLDEVTVSRKRITYRQKRYADVRTKYQSRGVFHFSSTPKFFAEDLFKHTPSFVDIFDLIMAAIPGAGRADLAGVRGISLGRGKNSVNFALNGQIVTSDYLQNIRAEAVDVIDVITGMKATAAYGVDPVIAILTKEGEALEKAVSKAQNIGRQQIEHPGFYQAKTYYQPDYRISAARRGQKADYRTTIYWNPAITIEDKMMPFEFYTGDIAGNYLIWVEGITQEGIPFTARDTFFVTEN